MDRSTTLQDINDRLQSLDIEIPTAQKQHTIPAPTYNCTDLGNSERFVHHHSQGVRYSHTAKAWYLWEGLRWQRDCCDAVRGLAKDTIRRIYTDECASAVDGEQREKLAKHAIKSEASSRITAMIFESQHVEPIPIQLDNLDQKPDVLVTTNCVVNLTTGKTITPDPEDYQTLQIGSHHDPLAKCPRWDQFLHEIMMGNDSMIDFIQRAVGYSMTGHVSEQCLFFLHGNGKNGKSTFIHILYKLMGEYAVKIPTSALMSMRNDNSPQEIARIRGRRLVIASEADDRHRFSETLIKDLTGGDIMPARELYGRSFDLAPVAKLWVYGNSQPQIKGTDEGIWRRIRMVPFDAKFDGSNCEPELLDTLIKELPGILNWCIEGTKSWLKQGLGIPEGVSTATSEYRQDMDHIADFVDSKCLVGKLYCCAASQIFEAYKKWCEDTGERSLSQKRLGRELGKRGFERGRQSSGRIQWFGIGLCESNSYNERTQPSEPKDTDFSHEKISQVSYDSERLKVRNVHDGSECEINVVHKCVNCINLVEAQNPPSITCAINGEGSIEYFDIDNRLTSRTCKDFEPKKMK